jgi:hypothetical protein
MAQTGELKALLARSAFGRAKITVINLNGNKKKRRDGLERHAVRQTVQ